jgi:formylglycine-generating enzyme required for sulfatase activity
MAAAPFLNRENFTHLKLKLSSVPWRPALMAAMIYLGLSPLAAHSQTLNVGGQSLIPAGFFTMGDVSDTNSEGSAAPTNIYVAAFFIDTNLVSYGQWQPVYSWATNNGYGFTNAGSGKAANHPVQTVDWYDAVKWCNARSQLAGLSPVYFSDVNLTEVYSNGEPGVVYVNWGGLGYRLPTEAEWERAARGGVSGLRFPWGNTINETDANYQGTNIFFYDLGPSGYNSSFDTLPQPYTSPVGSFAANGYGLTDTAGNVWEWCWDWYGPYGQPSTNNPTGQSSGSGRVLRGGGWDGYAYACRTAWRDEGPPNEPENDIGFRTVLANALPVITNVPLSQTDAPGASVSFSVGAAGASPLGYQWYFGGAPISGATNATLEITNVQTANVGAYTVEVSDPYGTTSAAASLSLAGTNNCVPAPPGLIAWWPGNGTANDIIGGNNGVLQGGVSYASGPSALAFDFDGTGTVIISNSPALNFAPDAPLTVEAWVYCTADGDLQNLVGKGEDCSGNTSPNYQLAYDFGSGDGLIFGGASGEATGVILQTNSWHHVVGTFDGDTSIVYLDGELEGAMSDTVLGPEGDSPLLIGGGGSCAMFLGMMQNTRLYNRALSADEVLTVFNASISGICTSPLPPYIVQPPADASVPAGATASFSVTVSGNAPLACQWYFGAVPLPGATNTALAISSVQTNNAGVYSVVVTNGYGATNATALLTVLPANLPPVTLYFEPAGGQVILVWPTGALQSAPTVAGPYTDVIGASSPYSVVPSGPQQYFRVKVQ